MIKRIHSRLSIMIPHYLKIRWRMGGNVQTQWKLKNCRRAQMLWERASDPQSEIFLPSFRTMTSTDLSKMVIMGRHWCINRVWVRTFTDRNPYLVRLAKVFLISLNASLCWKISPRKSKETREKIRLWLWAQIFLNMLTIKIVRPSIMRVHI